MYCKVIGFTFYEDENLAVQNVLFYDSTNVVLFLLYGPDVAKFKQIKVDDVILIERAFAVEKSKYFGRKSTVVMPFCTIG